MTSSATSPAPWSVNASGGAITIVARDRSVVAVVMGSGSAAPFESSNAALMAAAPELLEAMRVLVDVGEFATASEKLDAKRRARAALAKAQATR